jgi:protein-disulfide isomerase
MWREFVGGGVRQALGFGFQSLLAASLALAQGRSVVETCKVLTPALNRRLAAYVASKYDLAPDLAVEDDLVVGPTCFRRVRFRSAGGGREIELYLSPDQRFLSESLWDTSVDPAIERKRVADEAEIDLNAGNSPVRGTDDAPVTIVVFSDFQCPFCKRFADFYFALPETDARRVKLVFKHFPLSMHQWARPAAIASICAGAQGVEHFWGVHDFLFANQDKITVQNLDAQLATLTSTGLDTQRLRSCVGSGAADEVLTRDAGLVEKYHINAAPTIFVNGVRMQGGFGSTADLQTAIRLRASDRAPAASGRTDSR